MLVAGIIAAAVCVWIGFFFGVIYQRSLSSPAKDEPNPFLFDNPIRPKKTKPFTVNEKRKPRGNSEFRAWTAENRHD